MDNNTAKLVEQLAQKLGTTTEYLWAVLLKQAPINATVNLVQIGLIVLFGWMLYRWHIKLGLNDDEYADGSGLNSLWMTIGLVVFIILSFCSFFSIENVINGYFDPEYWALKKVLSILKN